LVTKQAFEGANDPSGVQLHSVYPLASNCFLPERKNNKIPMLFYSRAIISFFMASFHPGIDKASDIDLGTKYESIKDIKV